MVTEERQGEQWQVGMPVRVYNRYENPPQFRDGVIVDRSWGRERGAPIWRFTVEMPGVEGGWVFNPGELQPPK